MPYHGYTSFSAWCAAKSLATNQFQCPRLVLIPADNVIAPSPSLSTSKMRYARAVSRNLKYAARIPVKSFCPKK